MVELDDGRPETAPWPHEREHGDRSRGDAVRIGKGGIVCGQEPYQLGKARIVADHDHAAGGVVDRLESCHQNIDAGPLQAVFDLDTDMLSQRRANAIEGLPGPARRRAQHDIGPEVLVLHVSAHAIDRLTAGDRDR